MYTLFFFLNVAVFSLFPKAENQTRPPTKASSALRLAQELGCPFTRPMSLFGLGVAVGLAGRCLVSFLGGGLYRTHIEKARAMPEHVFFVGGT